MFITYLPTTDDVSLEEVENVGRACVTLGSKHCLWMAGDSLFQINLILSPENSCDYSVHLPIYAPLGNTGIPSLASLSVSH